MQQMAFCLLIPLSFLMISPVKSFNLDTRYFTEINQSPNQYFGYSIGFRRYSNKYKILVGSPKANGSSESDIPSGAMYECDIDPPFSCQTVVLSLPSERNIMRKNQWLGVSLDINPQNSQIIVCAHRVVHKNYNAWDSLEGACYEFPDTAPNQTLQRYNVGYYSATYGISCRYSQDGDLLVGIPGFQYGGFDLTPRYRTSTYSRNAGHDYYEGYAVTFLGLHPVIGKPRFDEYGAVLVSRELVRSPKTKYSFGSYFGSAIATADFNGDNNKDLVIGAPFYSETFTEEGRVYIYLFDTLEGMFFEDAAVVLKEPSYRAQFGKSLVTGDFNSDTLKDVIVGAPYENDGTGCIYVYNGKYGGLDPTYSQRIKGESLRNGLKSFGISFTRAIDVDQNRYEDIGVGAYLSDSVYVFRARPTYSTKVDLIALPRLLDIEPDCIFNGRHVLCMNLTVKITLSIQNRMNYSLHLITDSSKIREECRTYFNGQLNELTEFVTVGPFFKKTFRIFIKSTADIMSPIDFKLHYKLVDQGYSALCQPLCPISKNGTVTETVRFNLKCGPDEICETRLRVKVNSSKDIITLGKDKKLKMFITVSNTGERAYFAIARVFFSPFMDFESVNKAPNSSVECTSVNKMELSCFLGNPMEEMSIQTFDLNFSIDTASNVTAIFVAVNATTESSVKPQYFVNTVNLTVLLYREFNLELAASSVPDALAFTGNDDPISVKHIYYLRNNGPSDALMVKFSLYIPYIVINNSPLMAIKVYRMLDEDEKPINLASNNIVCNLATMIGKATEHQTDVNSVVKHKNIADCSWLKCHKFTCKLNELPIGNPKVFELILNINPGVLKTFQNKIRVISVASNGVLSHAMSDRIIKAHQDQANATTEFIISRLRKKIKWWIIVLSILVGLIILVIAGIGLWKCGFFQRNRVSAEDRQRVVNEENPVPPETEPEEERS